MASRKELVDWVYAALNDLGGKGKIAEIGKHIWEHHEEEIKASGDFFYKWQYEMRWAGDELVRTGKITKKVPGLRGCWAIVR